MSARSITLMAAAALLAGCAGLPPRSELKPPAAGIATVFPAVAAPGAVPADALPWKDFFPDASLHRLIEGALQNSRDLRLSVLAIEQARAQLQLREADQQPTVNAALSGSRTPTGTGAINTLYFGGLQLTAYEIDLFDRVRNLASAAQAQFQATEAQRRAAQISLIASVAQAWLTLQTDEALLALTRQTIESRTQTLQLTEARARLGAASMADVRAAQAQLEATRATLAQLQRQQALDGNALSVLLGLPWSSLGVAVSPLKQSPGFPELAAGLPSDVLRRRPDLQAAELQLSASEASIEAARASFFPRITLTASAGSATRALTNLFSAGSSAFSLAPQLVQPLFDAGRNQASLKSATVAREQALAQYERAVQQAFREVADALAARSTLLDQLQAQQAQAAAEAERVALTEVRYRHGAASFLELLDAQRSLYAVQQSLVLSQSLWAQSSVALYKALGGGWN